MWNSKDITNKKYWKLTAIKFIKTNKQGNSIWLFKCDCGNIKEIRSADVASGNTKSCGCLFSEKLIKRNTTHGMRHTRFYKTWNGIKARCNNPKEECYKYYGERGIKCEWKSFEEFYKDMFPTYQNNLFIERIDNNGNYCKKNCRWATKIEQANNKRNNHFLFFNGKKQTIAEWHRELGIKYNTIKTRMARGYPIDKILSINLLK